MRGSFTFQGIDIETFGLTYVPEASNIYVFDRSTSNINQKVFDGHNGGYFYGSTLQPKVFNLRCYFERNNINHGLVSKINSFFKIGREGKLVFGSRPYIYYNVVVTGIDNTKYLNQNNGYVTLNFTAFYPYGRTDMTSYDGEDENILNNTGLIPASKISSTESKFSVNKALRANIESKKRVYYSNSKRMVFINNDIYSRMSRYLNNILLYNAGNEQCGVSLKIKPKHDIKIINTTNGTYCDLVHIDDFVEKYSDRYIIIDGISGNIYSSDDEDYDQAFLYHKAGFLSLEPSMPIKRNIEVSCVGKNVSSLYGIFDIEDVGKFIYINDRWIKIKSYTDQNNIVLETEVEGSTPGTITTDIVLMNEIKFEGEYEINDSVELIEFNYNPTFS